MKLWRDGSERDSFDAILAGSTIQFSAAACHLAQCIWSARRQAYDEPRQWMDLSPRDRQSRVLQAAWILRTNPGFSKESV